MEEIKSTLNREINLLKNWGRTSGVPNIECEAITFALDNTNIRNMKNSIEKM